jgi:hypothetical protein
VVLRVSPAKDRTLKRVLYALGRVGEQMGRRDVVRLTAQLHGILTEMGHDV